jgi:amidase
MAASVRQAAELLTVIAGSDPADPATQEADRHKTDYAAQLDANALRGKRIGVLRFASSATLDPSFDTALAILRKQGAILVDIKKFDQKGIGDNENVVLHAELKADMAKYLKGSPAPIAVRTLADLIAFDKAHARQEMPLFGQEYFEESQKT